ncbi:T9SS type A sorting domain-containing protein [Chryseobacterium sp. ERMR1:04]|uniref:T9SS type A sorting domain-containing protein n=1 Tax=Chryseobacterium sp. ERMR1:04 TaxID=1705393 RepID=UPI0006C87FD3|nr:T9SS type A sorting domain-containing protein [Chryseobacterium sp. ERMR1:04]
MKKMFTALVFLLIGKAYSQIIYTPVTPNFEINLSQTGGSSANLFPIDFNNDGVVDFNFRWNVYGTGTYFMHITSSNSYSYNSNNQVIVKGMSNSYGVPYAMPLDVSTPIGPSSTGWITEARGPLIGDGESSNFLGLGDKYIGIRFLSAGQYYYGWVLVSFVTNKLIIKSYAYQTASNTGIEAGNEGGSLGVEKKDFINVFNLYPNPTTEYLKIVGNKETIGYAIHNMEGKKVRSGIVNADNEINVSELIKGTYVISINNKNWSTKFIKK